MAQLNTRIVLRNDSTINWSANADSVLLKGEIGIEFTPSGAPKMKIGDGSTKWDSLPYFGASSEGSSVEAATYYDVVREQDESDLEAIRRVVGTSVLNKGDVAIVKTLVSEDNYQHTAYLYNGTVWTAMDGNYNAESVYFDEDLITTSAIGNITLKDGQATIPTTGKNLKQVFETIYVKEKNPSTTQPSVSLTVDSVGSYEVGTIITPSYSAVLNAGKYSYGPATNITASSWEISDTEGNVAKANSGSFSDITVSDSIDYKITAKATYNSGSIPVTNLGNAYASGQIPAGSKSTTSGSISGYRNTFYGTLSEKSEITSELLRGLNSSDAALSTGSKFVMEIPVGALRVVIAYPSTIGDITSISDVNGLGAEIKSSFSKSLVSVEGANGFIAIEYNVYTMDFANANDTANTYSVQI